MFTWYLRHALDARYVIYAAYGGKRSTTECVWMIPGTWTED